MDIQDLYTLYQSSKGVTTDTRNIAEGMIFFALKGENFNGNNYAIEALQKGAAYAVVEEVIEEHKNLIVVKNVLETIQDLAALHLSQFDVPVLAITGSNGKTTTKELIHTVLSKKYKTYTTKGNLNNHIGIPLTILSIQKDAEFIIIEMGANHLGEIASYCKIVRPQYGIITNCGKAHLEGFGSEEGVRKGKGELYDYLIENMGGAFIYDDAPYLRKMANGMATIITYGTSPSCAISGNVYGNDDKLAVQLNNADKTIIQTNLIGQYNLPNVLAAVTVGRYFNIDLLEIKDAIENYQPTNSRSQLVEKFGAKIIMDAYNANPSSLKIAIENLSKLNHPRKVLMIGSMAELGASTNQEHENIIQIIRNHNWSEVVLVGPHFEPYSSEFKYFSNSTEARDWFQQKDWTDAYILIKGSRSQQMEKIIA